MRTWAEVTAKSIQRFSDDPLVQQEKDALIAYLVPRAGQLQTGLKEQAQLENNGHGDLVAFTKAVKGVKEWKTNSRGEWAWATLKGGEIQPSLREVVQTLRAAGRNGIVSDGYRYTVSDGRDGAVFLNRNRA